MSLMPLTRELDPGASPLAFFGGRMAQEHPQHRDWW